MRTPTLRGSTVAREKSWWVGGAALCQLQLRRVSVPFEAGFGSAEHVLQGRSPEYTLEAAAPVASRRELAGGLSASGYLAQPPAQNAAWPAARGVLWEAASGDARRALRRILGIVVQRRVRAGATQPRRLLDAFVARQAYSLLFMRSSLGSRRIECVFSRV